MRSDNISKAKIFTNFESLINNNLKRQLRQSTNTNCILNIDTI